MNEIRSKLFVCIQMIAYSFHDGTLQEIKDFYWLHVF